MFDLSITSILQEALHDLCNCDKALLHQFSPQADLVEDVQATVTKIIFWFIFVILLDKEHIHYKACNHCHCT